MAGYRGVGLLEDADPARQCEIDVVANRSGQRIGRLPCQRGAEGARPHRPKSRQLMSRPSGGLAECRAYGRVVSLPYSWRCQAPPGWARCIGVLREAMPLIQRHRIGPSPSTRGRLRWRPDPLL